MPDFPKPRIVVSKCLGFANCRYNGQTIRNPFIEKLKNHVEFLPVCPEVEIGLGIPRQPIRITLVKGRPMLYQPATERDVTEEMTAFVKKHLDTLSDIDGFILKNRSPSCGPWDVKVYEGLDKSARSGRGSGFFADEVLKRFPGAALEDEGRLKNYELRDHFLIRLYTLARFRVIRSAAKMKDLVAFHSTHKYLLLAYNQTRFRLCGKIVANHERLPPKTVYEHYDRELRQILKTKPRYTSMINTLHHAYGGISEGLSKEEKTFFLNTVEEYRDERIPLSAVIRLLHAHAIRFRSSYLSDQVLLAPYPADLVEVSDSGKGRS